MKKAILAVLFLAAAMCFGATKYADGSPKHNNKWDGNNANK